MPQHHNNVTFEGLNATGTQITINGLVQITPNEDGSVTIDLAGKHVEVERIHGSRRMLVRRSEATVPPAEPQDLIEMLDEAPAKDATRSGI